MGAGSSAELSKGIKKLSPPIVICVCCQSELSETDQTDYNATQNDKETQSEESESVCESDGGGGDSSDIRV